MVYILLIALLAFVGYCIYSHKKTTKDAEWLEERFQEHDKRTKSNLLERNKLIETLINENGPIFVPIAAMCKELSNHDMNIVNVFSFNNTEKLVIVAGFQRNDIIAEIPYSSIIDCELSTTEAGLRTATTTSKVIASSLIKNGALGALAFGTPGAMVGATVADRKYETSFSHPKYHYLISIYTNSVELPSFTLNFFNDIEAANSALGLLKIILSKNTSYPIGESIKFSKSLPNMFNKWNEFCASTLVNEQELADSQIERANGGISPDNICSRIRRQIFFMCGLVTVDSDGKYVRVNK